MTRTEAIKAFVRLTRMTGGQDAWDAATVATWAEEVMRLEEPDVAQEATAQLIRSWTGAGRPPYAVWLEGYNRLRQRNRDENRRPALRSSTSEQMGPALYLASLIERAENGSETAITELGNWWRSGAAGKFLDRDKLDALGVDTRERNHPHPMAKAFD